jgi:hypothetical protein
VVAVACSLRFRSKRASRRLTAPSLCKRALDMTACALPPLERKVIEPTLHVAQ